MGSYFREQLESYLKSLDIKYHTIVDVGGSQNPVNKRTRSFRAEEYLILDLKQPHHCERVPDMVGDIASNTFEYKGPVADAVFCLEVMEYVIDPVITIKNLASILKKEGTLYISFPYLYPLHPPTGHDFLRYTKFSAIHLLGRAGFEVTGYYPRVIKNFKLWQAFISGEGYRYDRSLTDELFESGCIIRARKKE